MLGYHVPDPDEAMLVSGGKARDNAPFRVITGHGAWVMPFFRKVRYLSLAMYEAEIQERCVTKQAIQLDVRALAIFRFGEESPHAHVKSFFAFSKKLSRNGFTLASHKSANSFNFAFCSALSLVGTSTVTRTCKSPWP